MRPTFSGFSIAKLGLDAARANLQVTGQNMTNANTPGYTRQRVDLVAIGAGTRSMRTAAVRDASIGEGVQINGISQLRDPYLDVRYRREHAKAGDAVAEYDALKELSYIFGSVTENGLDTALTNLKKQLQALSNNPTDPVAGKIVKTTATTLLQIFNETAGRISTVWDQQLSDLQDKAVFDANNCLASIASLNKEIKSANISGNPALELLDERNQLIDQLSQYVNIETVTTKVDIGSGQYVEELSINMLGPHGSKFNLVDNGDYKQFSVESTYTDASGDTVPSKMGDTDHPIKIILNDRNGKPVDYSNDGKISLNNGDVSDCLTSGSFKGYLSVINDVGEFHPTDPSIDRGIPYYMSRLDNLAQTFAETMNKANSLNDEPPWDKPLFESKDGGPITAASINISKQWDTATDNYLTNTKKQPDEGVKPESLNDNILFMIGLFGEKQTYTHTYKQPNPTPGDPDIDVDYPLFTGTFQECVSNIITTHGLQMNNVERQATSFTSNLNYVDTQRQSISAVNVDEEGINLIMFNQALTAASRYMTTLDEALETIITRMGVVGR